MEIFGGPVPGIGWAFADHTTSHIAACMSGSPESMVTYHGEEVRAAEAFKDAKLPTIEFQAKEALAVIISASFASTMAARVLFDSSIAVLLTQLTTAMSVDCLRGEWRRKSQLTF